MAGHSILYLGRGEFAAEYLQELETLPFCALLTRSASLKIPQNVPSVLDIVLFEALPVIAQSEQSVAELIGSYDKYPAIALTTRAHEHRGIAAVAAGADAYICVDDVTVDGQEAIFAHAVDRHRLQQRLSDTDVTVLSILRMAAPFDPLPAEIRTNYDVLRFAYEWQFFGGSTQPRAAVTAAN